MFKIIRTTCNRDCPDACGMLAHVENNRIIRLQGDKEHPVTQGFLCRRTSRFLKTQYSKKRILQPMVRKNGILENVSWNEVLDKIATTFQQIIDDKEPQSIFHYRSGGNLGSLLSVADLFWQALGPITTKRGDICTGALDAAQKADFGATDANDFFDVEHAHNLLIWGKNLHACSPHTYSHLKRKIDGGLPCTVIDPMPTQTAKMADRWIQPRVGGDFALAMAVASILIAERKIHIQLDEYADHTAEFFELVEKHSLKEYTAQAGVSSAEVAHLAELFSAKDQQHNIMPLTTLIGWGMGRRSNGATLIRAIDALHMITGQIGIQGATASYYLNRKAGFQKAKDCVDLSRLRLENSQNTQAEAQPDLRTNLPVQSRTFSEPLLAQELKHANPKVRAMWVTAGNPVAMLPESELLRHEIQKIDLVVVVDWWLSDTAQIADVVLPAATFLERNDVLGGYGHHYISRAQAVVSPAGQSKTDLQILQELSQKIGIEKKLTQVGFYDDELLWMKRLASPLLNATKNPAETYSKLKTAALRSPIVEKVAFAGRKFATPNQKAQLLTLEEAKGFFSFKEAVLMSEQKPLHLFAVSTPNSQSSQQIDLEAEPQVLQARVNPETYAEGKAFLVSAQSRLVVEVKHVKNQHKMIVHLDKGAKDEHGTPVNALLKARLTDHGEGGALYEERVWFEPLLEELPNKKRAARLF